MITAPALGLTLALATASATCIPPAALSPDAAEAVLEIRTRLFEGVLERTLVQVEASLEGPGTRGERRQAALAPIRALQPALGSYARDVRSGFAALAARETPERAAELTGYGEALLRYLEGLPADLIRSVDQDLAVAP